MTDKNEIKERVTHDIYESGNYIYHKLLLDDKQLLQLGFAVFAHGHAVNDEVIHININPKFYGLDWKFDEVRYLNGMVSILLSKRNT